VKGSSAPQTLHRLNACGGLVLAPAGAKAPTDRRFLVLFFKKEPLPYLL
jgi:hypothetical protein